MASFPGVLTAMYVACGWASPESQRSVLHWEQLWAALGMQHTDMCCMRAAYTGALFIVALPPLPPFQEHDLAYLAASGAGTRGVAATE